MKFDSVVEVQATLFPKGVLTYRDFIESFVFIHGDYADHSEPFKEEKPEGILSCGYDTKVTEETIGFQFSIIGEANDDTYSSGLDFERDNLSSKEIFGDWLSEFEKIARERIAKIKPKSNKLIDVFKDYEQKKGTEPTTVRFLTVWNYNCSADYNGEYDSDWEYLGLLRDIIK